MADDKKPQINITRGKRTKRASKKQAASSKAEPEGWSVPTGLGGLAREVWLAGLGTLSVVEEEGEKLFGVLVEEGKRWEQQRRDEAAAVLRAAQDAPKAARKTLDEQVVRRVQERTDAALERAGLPTKEALDRLKQQVDELMLTTDQLHAKLEKRQRDA